MTFVIRIHPPGRALGWQPKGPVPTTGKPPWATRQDGQLGTLVGARAVRLSGTTTVNALFNSSIFPIESWLQTALQNNGFQVNAVRYSWNSILPFHGDNTINFEIDIDEFNEYTSAQAAQNAYTAIEAYTANYGLNKVFSNTVVNVAADTYVAPGTQPTGTTPKTLPASTYDSSKNQGASSLDNLFSSKVDLSSVGLGAVSGGLVVGAIFLIILLKK